MDSEEKNGLSKQAYQRHFNMLKGRVAEALVEELFVSLGYQVFRYGMENTIPGIMQTLRGVKNDTVMHIRRMPDFIVQKEQSILFIEVKFRKSGIFTLKDSGEDYPYDDAYIVVVSKKHIKCITVKQLKEGKEVTPKTRNYLGSLEAFKQDKDKIIDFCEFAVKFFENVD